jgi:hypothetical protein
MLALAAAEAMNATSACTQNRVGQKVKLKSVKPDIAWKWGKWTIGFWTDYKNHTLFGIDIFPLEIVWRFEGYRQ